MSPAGKRRAVVEAPPTARTTSTERRTETWSRGAAALAILGVLAVVLAGLAAVGVGLSGMLPDPVGLQVASVGAVLVTTAYAVAVASRSGGRSAVYGGVALLLGIAAVTLDLAALRAGLAIFTVALSAVLGVLATVPAVHFWHALREVAIAMLVAGGGGLAAVGYLPRVDPGRFSYAGLLLAMVAILVIVWGLGAATHGLGARGLGMVVVGGGLLAAMLVYGELLSRYGTPGLVELSQDAAHWMRESLGGAPRPVLALVGVPALLWGCHQRARRRQGWWACAFGVAATAPLAAWMVYPPWPWTVTALSVLYSLLVGIVVGYLVIRADVAFSSPRGRRAHDAETASGVRPEPPRGAPLL